MSNEVRTRVLGESGAWVEADKPAERQPKARRFVLTASVPRMASIGGLLAEGVCFGDGAVALRWRGEQRSTAIYDTIEDVIAGNGHATMAWVD